MNLFRPEFVRALKRLLREERRRDPALRRACRRARKTRAWSHATAAISLRGAWGLLPAFLLAGASTNHWPVTVAPVIAAWWGLELVVLGQAVVIAKAVDHPLPLFLFPFANADFVRLARRRVLRLLWRPFLDSLWLFIALALLYHAGTWDWLFIPPFAALNAVALWTLAVALVHWPIPRPMAAIASVLPLALIWLNQTPDVMTGLRGVVTAHAGGLSALSPGGWLAAAYLSGLGQMPAVWRLGLAPALLLALLAPRALAALERRVAQGLPSWVEALAGNVPRQTVPVTEAEGDGRCASEPAARATATACMPDLSLVARLAPARPEPPVGWIERRLLAWLSPRERLVLECAASHTPEWTRMTRGGLKVLAAVLLATCAVAHLPVALAGVLYWCCGGVGVLALCAALPLASGFDLMTNRVHMYGVAIAQPALNPIDLREFLRLTTKAAALRGAVMVLPLAAAGAWLAWVFDQPLLPFALGGAKVALLSIASAPYLCMMAISGASSDSQARGLRGVRTMLLILAVSLALLALGPLTICIPGFIAGATGAAFAAISWFGAQAYTRAYNRGRFDLVQTPRA